MPELDAQILASIFVRRKLAKSELVSKKLISK